MELFSQLLDLFLHLDRHLSGFIAEYGLWTYLVLFLIIFCETGLVVTPFLPGDSLLFATGAVSAMGGLKVGWLLFLLCLAAVLGNTVNYAIGSLVGPKVFHQENVRFLNKEYLKRAHSFYEKYGGITIVIARFIPIIRTFAPFVAGIGKMTYWRFTFYNLVGSVCWVGIFVLGGYFFGNLPLVKKNFTLVILGIIIVSLLPPIIEFIRHRKKPK